MEEKEDKIVAYLEKRLSIKERNAFEEEMNASKELRDLANEYDYILRFSGKLQVIDQTSTDKRWDQLAEQVKKEKRLFNLLLLFRNAAAILLLPFIMSTFYFYHKTIVPEPEFVAEMIEITSAKGLVSKITLPDGSIVHLNSGSKLIYPQQFNQGERAVYLEGEAYFQVVSDKKNRFNVQAGDNIIVSAYGTEFNINAYADESVVETVLTNGNVEVKSISQNSSCTLNPGQQAVYQKETGDMAVSGANLLVKTAWKDGKLIFRRADMEEVIKRLSRHFNVDIILEGKEIEEYEYSATFIDETLKDVLYLLERSAPIQCRIIEPKQDTDYVFSRRQVIIKQLE